MAYKIIERLAAKGYTGILFQLELAVKPKDKSRGKKHEVWEDSFDAKECRTEKFIVQKLNYIHDNPCRGRWKLVKEPHRYPHSSALFYLNGRTSQFRVKDY